MNYSYKILFVDDSEANLFHAREIVKLDNIPVEIHFAKNPVEAISYLENVDGNDFPDAIISDIHMPMMDGFEFADAYGEKYKMKKPETTFFIASSSYHKTDLAKTKNHPVIEGFLEKPFCKEMYEKHILPILEAKIML